MKCSFWAALQPYSDQGLPRNLAARSHTRAPQMPLLPTITFSPGSTRLEMQASMPAWPEPLVMSTCWLSVWNTYRRPSWISAGKQGCQTHQARSEENGERCCTKIGALAQSSRPWQE